MRLGDLKASPMAVNALISALAVLAACLVGCGMRVAGGGDATETGNARVTGTAVLENGDAAAGAAVLVLPADYDPVRGDSIPDSLRAVCDASGAFHFGKLDSGAYVLTFLHGKTFTRALVGIKLGGDKLHLDKTILHIPGSLSVPIPESNDSGVGYVYVPGTTFRARINSETRAAGKVRIDSVPAAIIPHVLYTKGDAGSKTLIAGDSIKVEANALALVPPFHDWGHAARWVLNTGASGVSIAKDQYGFPLLVRLTAANFDFSQAQAGGADLRFAREDGTPLAREIEAWDAKAGHAEIWIRLDTVRAGDASQSISMHWGNANAAAPHYAPVFDSSRGFAGVYHLGEEAADTVTDGLYKDAVGAEGNGNDRIRNTGVTGAIAGGHGFDSSDYVYAPKGGHGLHSPMAFSLSTWFRSKGKGLGSAGGEMISVGDNFGLRLLSGGALHVFYWPPTQPQGLATPWWYLDVNDSSHTDGNWHLAMGTFDGSQLRLFVDGKQVGNTAVTGPAGYQFPVSVTLGKHGNGKTGYEYAGDLDEAEVHSVTRDADWARLSYENQKPGAGFPALSP